MSKKSRNTHAYICSTSQFTVSTMVCFVLLLPSLFISPLVLSCFLLFNSLLTLYPTTVIIIHDALTPTSFIIAVQADDLPNPHLKPVDAHLLAFKSTPWIGTLPFKGHFALILKFSVHPLNKPTISSNIFIHGTRASRTLFVSIH